jgi:hypothetical protein
MRTQKIKDKYILIAMALIFVFIGRMTLLNLEDRSWFGKNLIEYAPVKEVEFVKKYRLPGPILNDYLIGGYLIWALYPDYKVFIDPRYGPYWKETGPDYFEFMAHLNPETLRKFNQKYPFRTIILSMREITLINFLIGQPEWRLIYFDKAAVVIVHSSVIPTLSREALSTDMSPQKFGDVVNPIVLENLFNFYLMIGPQYARVIADIFTRNVTVFNQTKGVKLAEMRNRIAQREGQK